MRIIQLTPDQDDLVLQAAELLVSGFREHWPTAWPDLASALDEVRGALDPAKIARGAVGPDGELLGWVGALPEYSGNVWELHPLVVRPDRQQQGVGTALVRDLEAQVLARGALTLRLGTDDEDDMTSLSSVDLYDDLPGRIATVHNLKGHPYEFYIKCGFAIVGVVPDANGRGKPDILMAKRVEAQG